MRFQWLTRFCAWLEATSVSQTIQSVSWIVPAVQTVHILAIAMVLGSAVMIACHLLGWAGQDQSPRQVAGRFLPFIWWPLLALLATGLVMITGEPARSLANGAFQLKMVLLLGAIAATRVFQSGLAGTAASKRGEGAAGVQALARPARLLGIIALALWVGIILAGRWIAYT